MKVGTPLAIAVLALSACASTPSSDTASSEPLPTSGDESLVDSTILVDTIVAADGPTVSTVSTGEDQAACAGVADEGETFAYDEVDGADPQLLSLDVYELESGTKCPVIVYLHGGGWQTGDKRTTATQTKVDHFGSTGHVFVSVNYRLVADDNDVRWPTLRADVSNAVSWVLDNAESFGGDAERVTLMGHSAGAHLVSILGTNPDLLGSVGRTRDDVVCVVALDSVTYDLTEPASFEREIVTAAFGTDSDALRDGSPTVQTIEHADDGPLPRFLIVTRGRDVRLESSAELADAITSSGGDATVLDVSPYDHREANVELGKSGESLLTPGVDDFLAGCA